MGAQPSGAPGWPLLAFSTPSKASKRNVSIESWSSDRDAMLEAIEFSDFLFLPKRAPLFLSRLARIDRDLHIVSKPGVPPRPMQCPLYFAAAGRGYKIGCEPRAAQAAADGRFHRLPAVVGPYRLKISIVQQAQRAACVHSLDRAPA